MQIITAQQILVPKKVYIGDTAELRCTFNNGSPFLKQLVSEGVAELPLVSKTTTDSQDSAIPFATPGKDYEIQKITLSPAGVDFYQFTVTFTPWKTGELLFPPMEIEGADLIIEFKPVQIVSLISSENTNTTTLRDTAAPLLLPGTAYKLYGTIAAFIIILIVIIRIIVKRKSLLFYFAQKRLLKKYKKNKKQTLKQLKLTSQNDEGPAAAQKIQKLMRNYLEVRFDYPFTKTVTSEIMKGWQTATGGLLSDEKEEAFGEIVGMFIRTDYIRYSKDGKFNDNELIEIIEKLSSCIEILEAEIQEKSLE